jgi:glycosyltransferase involved in cell wall biosynthesis
LKNKKSIVVAGFNGFPNGFAEVQKIILISKGLILTGNDVTVICRNGFHNEADYPHTKVRGIYENINYIYASGSCFRNKNFLIRRVNEMKGRINEFLLLRKYKKNDKLDYVILSTRLFSLVLYYRILSRIFGFKTILNHVEFYSAMKKESLQISQWVNDKLFDRYAPVFSDAVFPISEFLVQHLKKISPDIKYLKLPILTDFKKYEGIAKFGDERYFLFCGHAGYKEIIEFIIDSFDILNNSCFFLYLIVNGNDNDVMEIKTYANQNVQKDKIRIFSKLPEKKLYSFYKSASALLIPLRPTFQDSARFPHKTGEYLASGNPVISTNYGEMKHYFKDGENMLLAESYDKKVFAEKMKFVISHPKEADTIGRNGQAIADEIFSYINMAPHIDCFLKSLK